jgi:DNA-nicking Smr family endonuclease
MLGRLWAWLFARPNAKGPEGEDEGELPDRIEVTDTLDLHGFFPEQVAEVVGEFLANALRLGIGEVRIVHGKGRSVLRGKVWEILEEDSRVAGFRQAPPERGGWGATIAYLVKSTTVK